MGGQPLDSTGQGPGWGLATDLASFSILHPSQTRRLRNSRQLKQLELFRVSRPRRIPSDWVRVSARFYIFTRRHSCCVGKRPAPSKPKNSGFLQAFGLPHPFLLTNLLEIFVPPRAEAASIGHRPARLLHNILGLRISRMRPRAACRILSSTSGRKPCMSKDAKNASSLSYIAMIRFA